MLMMAVHQVPSLTQEKYEQVVRRLTNGKSRVESLSDLPFEGLLVHITGQRQPRSSASPSRLTGPSSRAWWASLA
jgi:hypothetical protein